MPSTVQLRDDYDSVRLRGLARRSRYSRQIRRLLALAAVYDGMSRAEAAKVGGMDRQTLRDWAHRFNAEGPDGLRDRLRAGRARRLTDAQMQELAEIVETGPDPAVDGVVRWRRVDLKRVIEERFGVVYSERTIPLVARPGLGALLFLAAPTDMDFPQARTSTPGRPLLRSITRGPGASPARLLDVSQGCIDTRAGCAEVGLAVRRDDRGHWCLGAALEGPRATREEATRDAFPPASAPRT